MPPKVDTVGLAAAATPTPKISAAQIDGPASISPLILYSALLTGMPALSRALVTACNAPPDERAAA